MIAEIATGFQAFKAAAGLIKTLNAAATEAQINDVKLGLQASLLDMQAALAAAQNVEAAAADEIRGLKQQIVDLEHWEGEKKRYHLRAIDRHAFAYMPEPGMENGEPPHWLCQPCFENRKKSVLQFFGTVERAGAKEAADLDLFFRGPDAEIWRTCSLYTVKDLIDVWTRLSNYTLRVRDFTLRLQNQHPVIAARFAAEEAAAAAAAAAAEAEQANAQLIEGPQAPQDPGSPE